MLTNDFVGADFSLQIDIKLFRGSGVGTKKKPLCERDDDYLLQEGIYIQIGILTPCEKYNIWQPWQCYFWYYFINIFYLCLTKQHTCFIVNVESICFSIKLGSCNNTDKAMLGLSQKCCSCSLKWNEMILNVHPSQDSQVTLFLFSKWFILFISIISSKMRLIPLIQKYFEIMCAELISQIWIIFYFQIMHWKSPSREWRANVGPFVFSLLKLILCL